MARYRLKCSFYYFLHVCVFKKVIQHVIPAMLFPPSSELCKDISTFCQIRLLEVICVFGYVNGNVSGGESRPGGCCLSDSREAQQARVVIDDGRKLKVIEA